LHKNGTNGLKWIDFIKKTFDEIGLSFIFTNQLEINPNWIKVHAKQILCDQFVQRWRGDIFILLTLSFAINFLWTSVSLVRYGSIQNSCLKIEYKWPLDELAISPRHRCTNWSHSICLAERCR
jgi:hypothetical protein